MLSLWLWYLLIFIMIVMLMKYHWKRRKLYRLANTLNGPLTLPFLGNALTFLCKEEDVFERLKAIYSAYSSPIRFWLGPKLVVAFKTAPEMEKILTSSKCNDKDDIYRFLKMFNGLSLFTTNGWVWKRNRKFVTPFLGPKYMEGYFDVICKQSEILIKVLEERVDKSIFDIKNDLSRCFNDIVTEVLMGFHPQAQIGKLDYLLQKISRTYILIHARMLKVWLHPDFIFQFSLNGKQQKSAKVTFHKHITKGFNFIEARNNLPKFDKNNKRITSILEHLIVTKNMNPDHYANENIFDHIATLYSASEDTVTTICSYLLVVLGMYPDIQNKIVAEIQSILKDTTKRIDYKTLPELKYLDMCVKEVIRLFPIGPYILRKIKEDFQLGDRILPKDCTIILSFYNVQRDPNYWEKPNEFYPEHFLPEAVAKRHPYAFLPFSSGARSCPGQLFAYTAIKTVAAMVLQKYVTQTDETLQNMKLKSDISIRPVNGYKLRIRRRIN